jgi:hypothetical protein
LARSESSAFRGVLPRTGVATSGAVIGNCLLETLPEPIIEARDDGERDSIAPPAVARGVQEANGIPGSRGKR